MDSQQYFVISDLWIRILDACMSMNLVADLPFTSFQLNCMIINKLLFQTLGTLSFWVHRDCSSRCLFYGQCQGLEHSHKGTGNTPAWPFLSKQMCTYRIPFNNMNPRRITVGPSTGKRVRYWNGADTAETVVFKCTRIKKYSNYFGMNPIWTVHSSCLSVERLWW